MKFSYLDVIFDIDQTLVNVVMEENDAFKERHFEVGKFCKKLSEATKISVQELSSLLLLDQQGFIHCFKSEIVELCS